MPFQTRALTLYNGSDALPANDYTTDTIWEETELASMAFNGDAATSTWHVRDEDGIVTDRTAPGRYLSSHNVVKLTVGSNMPWQGRVDAQDRRRGRQKAGRAAEWSINLGDANRHLQGIIVHNWVRGAETDAARVQGLVAQYLSGSPRATTNLNGSNLVITGSNTVSLPAKTYTGITPYEILQELAETADKEMFVTDDDQLAYFGHDHAGYAATFRISDDPADLDAATCVPINPSASEEGRDQLTALRTYWGADTEERTFRTFDNSHMVTTDYWEDVFYDADSVNATEAEMRTNAIFAQRRLDEISYTVTIGAPGTAKGQPMSGDDLWKVKAGQQIQFKSLAARGGKLANGSWAGDTFLTTRIRERRITFTDAADQYWVTLILERPKGRGGRGKVQPAATTPKPPAGSTVASCAADVAQMTAISTPNGDFETGAGGNWTGENIQPAAAGAQGNWMSHDTGIGPGGWLYDGWTGLTFLAGVTYVVRMQLLGSGGNTAQFGLFTSDGVGTDYAAATGTTGLDLDTNVFRDNCIAWTPSANRTGVRFSFSRSASGSIGTDTLTLYTGGGADSTGDVVGTGEGSTGTNTGIFAPVDHDHEHGNITTGGPYHEAADVTFSPTGTIAATDVQAAIAEVASEAVAGAPTTADYLVGTANAGLSAEIAVGTTPGGELGGTWASPTVDATHSGSTHSAATDTHIADTSAAHVASSIGFTPNGSIAATDVQSAIQEVRDEASGSTDLDDLTDVTITAPAEGDMLRFDGSIWVNSALRWEPVTTNPGTGPEVVFDGDDIVMTWADYS